MYCLELIYLKKVLPLSGHNVLEKGLCPLHQIVITNIVVSIGYSFHLTLQKWISTLFERGGIQNGGTEAARKHAQSSS